MRLCIRRLGTAIVAAWLAAAPVPASAQETLATARDMYAAAAYEDALVVLNRLRAGSVTAEDGRAIEQYRAFCLLALGRPADAEDAIETLVAADPLFEPATDVSPRIRSAFTDVRKRMLPGIVQQNYTAAKAQYDRKEFANAAAGFKRVLAVLADPQVAAAAQQPPLSDIRTLAAGFHDLSAAAAAPPPPPQPIPPPQPVAAPAVVAGPPPVYGPEDPAVTPPVALRQSLPPFPLQGQLPPQGAIEVLIDETGSVEAAVMRAPLTPSYDRQALAAAREWVYRPALLNGVPVKYRKIIQITVKR